MKRKVAAFLLVFGITLAFTVPALAHAELVNASPQDGEHLSQPPQKVDLYFSEDLEPSLSSISVIDSSGKRVDQNNSSLDPANAAHLSVSLEKLSDGYYTVYWKTASADDGHLQGGSYIFSVGETSGLTPVASSQSLPPTTNSLQMILKGLLYLSVAFLVGGNIFRMFVWKPSAQRSGFPESLRVFQFAFFVMLIMAIIASLASLWTEVSAANSASLSSFWIALTSTRAGLLVTARLGLLLFLIGLLLPAPNRWNRLIALPVSLFLLLSFSLLSHAASQPAPWLPVLSDMIHMGAASIWVGGLLFFLLAFLAARPMKTIKHSELVIQLLARFSSLAFASAGLLVITGVYASLLDIGSFTSLVDTAYGQALLLKLILAAGLVALGAYNHFIQRSRWQAHIQQAGVEDGIFSKFRLSLTIETMLGIGLLLWVGVFTSLPPAKVSLPKVVLRTQNDHSSLQLTVTPAKVGLNTYSLKIELPPGSTAQVTGADLLFFSSDTSLPPTVVPLTPTGSDEYQTQGAYLGYPDQWQIRATVHYTNLLDSHTDFPVLNLVSSATIDQTALKSLLFAFLVAVSVFDIWAFFKDRGSGGKGIGKASAQQDQISPKSQPVL